MKLYLLALTINKLIVVVVFLLLKTQLVILTVCTSHTLNDLLKGCRGELSVLFEDIFLSVDLRGIVALDEPWVVAVFAIELVLELATIGRNIVIVGLAKLVPLKSPILVVFKLTKGHLRTLERGKSWLAAG